MKLAQGILTNAFASALMMLAPVGTLAQVEISGGWLDTETANWNALGSDIPEAPTPNDDSIYTWWERPEPDSQKAPAFQFPATTSAQEKEYFLRCEATARPATLPEDQQIQEMGWVPMGVAQIYGPLTVVNGMAAVDGMCRPMQFQTFVFSDGKFAGTLSPTPMDSRSDGSISIPIVSSVASIAATFERYKESDAACCPSASSFLAFTLEMQDGQPLVVPQWPAQTNPNE